MSSVLSPVDRRVLLHAVGTSDVFDQMAQLAQVRNPETPWLFDLSLRTLSYATGIAKSTLSRTLSHHVSRGFLAVLNEGNNGTPTTYRMCEPRQVAEKSGLLSELSQRDRNLRRMVQRDRNPQGYRKGDDVSHSGTPPSQEAAEVAHSGTPDAAEVVHFGTPEVGEVAHSGTPHAKMGHPENAVLDGFSQPPSRARVHTPARAPSRATSFTSLKRTSTRSSFQMKSGSDLAGPSTPLHTPANETPPVSPAEPAHPEPHADAWQEAVTMNPWLPPRLAATPPAPVAELADELVGAVRALETLEEIEAGFNPLNAQLALYGPLGGLWRARVNELGMRFGNGMSVQLAEMGNKSPAAGLSSYHLSLTLKAVAGQGGRFAWPVQLRALTEDRRFAAIFPTAAGDTRPIEVARSRALLAIEFIRFLSEDPYESGDHDDFRTSNYAAVNRRQLTDAQNAVTNLRPTRGKPGKQSENIKLVKFMRYLERRAQQAPYMTAEQASSAAANVRPASVSVRSGYYFADLTARISDAEVATIRRVVWVANTATQRFGQIGFTPLVRHHPRSAQALSSPYQSVPAEEWAAMNPEPAPSTHPVMQQLDALDPEDAAGYRRILNQLHPPRKTAQPLPVPDEAHA